MGKFVDLTGKKFGRWTVLGKSDKRTKNGGIMWDCICDCGSNKIHTVSTANLNNGSSTSCGCKQREGASKSGKNRKKYNNYDLSNNYGIGYTSKGEKFYFDLEDYNKIKDYCWYLSNEYVSANTYGNDKTHSKILMHRLIMGCIDDYDVVVDHINHITYDNRKINLRIVTQSQNAKNCKLSKNNTSGVTGVYFDNHSGKWVAEIKVNYKKHSLGHFVEFEDAVKARKDAEKKFFGEFSYDYGAKQS